MSKMVNNYRGKHRGYLQNKPTPKQVAADEKRGLSTIMQMWMNYAVKMGKFVNARNMYREQLEVKGKKALTGKKRERVLDKYFAVRYA